MATHPSILAWRIPWTEEPGGLRSMGFKELDMTKQLTHINAAEFTLSRAEGQSSFKKETFLEEGKWQLYFLEVLLKFR